MDSTDMNLEPTASALGRRCVQLAILTDLPDFGETKSLWLREYLASLASRRLANVVAVWAPKQNSSEAIIKTYFTQEVRSYFGISFQATDDANNNKTSAVVGDTKAKRSLEALVEGKDCNVDGLVLRLNPATHAVILRRLFILRGFNKHILSTDAGFCLVGPENLLSEAVQMHYASKKLHDNSLLAINNRIPHNPLWFVMGSLRFEPVVKALCEMLPEIGTTVGGMLKGSLIPTSGCESTGSLGQRMLELLIGYVSLLRKVFGEIQSVSSEGRSSNVSCKLARDLSENTQQQSLLSEVEDESRQLEVGSVRFLSGAACAITVMPSATPMLSLTVHGTLGCLSLIWDQTKQCFELHRSLKHFEHPSLHPTLGHSWCFAGWLEAIWHGFDHGIVSPHVAGSCFETLVDVTVAKAMIESHGVIVNFRPVPISSTSRSTALAAPHRE